MNKVPAHILPLIVFSQFAGTSLWFAVNAVIIDLRSVWDSTDTQLGSVTASVQLGFITGTLLSAIFNLSDRFKATGLFLISACTGSIFNIACIWLYEDFWTIYLLRFLVGVALAGIYPVGMKIAAEWFDKGLGRALGFLVGALVLGTALPHLLRAFTIGLSWKLVFIGTSAFCLFGALLMFLFVPNGPNHTRAKSFEVMAIPRMFKNEQFRSYAFGYFGHMWELYSFWAFVPMLTFALLNLKEGESHLLNFFIIAVGAISCSVGGVTSQKVGSATVARTSLFISGVLCLLSPILASLPGLAYAGILLIWGAAVISDSPQFSSLIARFAPPEYKGTALTIVNSIGFFITVLSLELIDLIAKFVETRWLLIILVLGPVFGLYHTGRLKSKMAGSCDRRQP